MNLNSFQLILYYTTYVVAWLSGKAFVGGTVCNQPPRSTQTSIPLG